MRFTTHQLAVALPFALVSALGIGVSVQNYGFESTDRMAVAPVDTPAELNAVRGPADEVPAAPKSRMGELMPPDVPCAERGSRGFAKPAVGTPAAAPASAAAPAGVPPAAARSSSNAADRARQAKIAAARLAARPACVPARLDARRAPAPELPLSVASVPGTPAGASPAQRSSAAAGRSPMAGSAPGVRSGTAAGVGPDSTAGITPGTQVGATSPLTAPRTPKTVPPGLKLVPSARSRTADAAPFPASDSASTSPFATPNALPAEQAQPVEQAQPAEPAQPAQPAQPADRSDRHLEGAAEWGCRDSASVVGSAKPAARNRASTLGRAEGW